MVIHFSILIWGIPWTEEPSGLQFMGPQKSWIDLATQQQWLIFYSLCNQVWWLLLGFSGGTSDKEPTYQSKRCKRCGFDPCVGKIPWRRAWQPAPVFLPGEPHGQRSHRVTVRHDWSDLARLHMVIIITILILWMRKWRSERSNNLPPHPRCDKFGTSSFLFLFFWLNQEQYIPSRHGSGYHSQ